jgi:glyoxylate carboligase
VNGGALVAQVLERHGVRFLFTLCGGHISPILVECKRRNIRVVDTRHEATAVFAADAVARLTGIPGVAAVTAGPGVTNASPRSRTPSSRSRPSCCSAAPPPPCSRGAARCRTSTSSR